MVSHILKSYFYMAVRHHLLLLCSGVCWPRSIQAPDPTEKWVVEGKALGPIEACLPGPSEAQGRANCVIFGVWSYHKKQYLEGLGLSPVCKMSGISRGKVKKKKDLRCEPSTVVQ